VAVETTQTQVEYEGDELVLEYAVPFPFLDNSHIKVYWSFAEIVEQLLVEGVDYTIEGAGTGEAQGVVTLLFSPDNGSTILIKRVTPQLQPKALRLGGTFGASTHENAWDRLTMMVQELEARVAALEAALNLGDIAGIAALFRTIEGVTPVDEVGELTWAGRYNFAVPAGFTLKGIAVLRSAASDDSEVVGAVTISQWTQNGTQIDIDFITGLEVLAGGAVYTLELLAFGEQA
jgi:hypothetical protein